MPSSSSQHLSNPSYLNNGNSSSNNNSNNLVNGNSLNPSINSSVNNNRNSSVMAGKDKRKENSQQQQQHNMSCGREGNPSCNSSVGHSGRRGDSSRPEELDWQLESGQQQLHRKGQQHQQQETEPSSLSFRRQHSSSGRSSTRSEDASTASTGLSITNDSSSGCWSCVVCCQKVPGPSRKEFYAIGPCDHPVCVECSTKMRVLCDQDECAICRGEIAKVMFTSRRDQKYASFNFDPTVTRFNADYLIYFENEAAEKMFNSLLLHPCRVCQSRVRRERDPGGGTTPSASSSPSSSSCLSSNPASYEFKSLKDLDAHLRREHEYFLCDICTEHLKVFTKERKYYTRRDLVQHRKTGDPDDSSHRGHPLCKFCDVRYLDDEALHHHLRKEHYYCHFCDPLGLNQFYDSYGNLRDHFRKEHFLCEEGTCKEEKFTSVFRSEIDMQAHRAVNHCSTRMEAKEARILSLDFTLKPRSTGGLAPQITASFQHQSRRGIPGQSSSGLLGAIGGQDMIESDDTELLLPQELPRPEDFPTLATESVTAGSTKESSSAVAVSGNREPSSYSDLAEKAKDYTQKVPQFVEKKNRKGNATFSSRIGGSGLTGRLDDDFPALSSGFSGMALCPPVPTGSSVPSKKDLKNASKYATTLSSVAAAVTAGVPKVVSKVATATCLPSGSSLSSGPGIMSCSSNNSKTLSTQSLLSSSSSVTPTSFQVKDFSVKSSTDFPCLPVIEGKKKGNKGLSTKTGNTNGAFSGSSESFGPSNSNTTKTAATAVTATKKLDFAAKVAAAPVSKKKNPSSSQVKSGLQTIGSSDKSSTSKSTSETGGESFRTRLKVDAVASVTSFSGSSSTAPKSVQLKNENEFPGLEPASSSNRLSSTNVKNNKESNNRAGQQKSSSTSKNPSTSTTGVKGGKNQTTITTTNKGTGVTTSNASKTPAKKSTHVSSNGSGNSNSTPSGQAGKKAPPPPPDKNSTSMSNVHHSKSKDTSSSSCSAGSITLSSVAQVIMGSCGPSGSSSLQNKTSSSSGESSRRNHHHQQNSRTSSTDENGNSCNSGSEITSSRDQEENLINLDDDSLGTSRENNRKDNDFNHRHMSGGVNDRSSGRAETNSRSNAAATSSAAGVTSSFSAPETFVPPTNFEERNLSLVKEVSDILQDSSKFSAFKKVSNDFRRGETRGDEYYKKCIELFGRNNFGKIFSELITLLPNVRKQNELLSAHEKSVKMSQTAVSKTGHHHRNDSSSSSSGVWIINNASFTEQGLLVCPSCQQVLAKRDGPEHMSLHQKQH